jgi:predicted nucleotidyltransferase
MRLGKKEIDAIKEVSKKVFGSRATVQLFGSRTDDSLKGGDIDLLIFTNREISHFKQYQLKIKFLVQLKKIIGDQKIDVLIERDQQSDYSKEMHIEGIPL